MDLQGCLSWHRINWYFVLVQEISCCAARVLDFDAALEWIIVTHQGHIHWPRAQRPQFQVPDALHNSPLCILKRNKCIAEGKKWKLTPTYCCKKAIKEQQRSNGIKYLLQCWDGPHEPCPGNTKFALFSGGRPSAQGSADTELHKLRISNAYEMIDRFQWYYGSMNVTLTVSVYC